MQRVKDADALRYDLERPPAGAEVTAEDLDADAANFMAFASAFGVKPPVPALATAAVVESQPSAAEG